MSSSKKKLVKNQNPAFSKLENYRKQASLGGGAKRIEAQTKKGKLTARKRLELILDPNSFVETDAFVVHNCRDFGMEKTEFLGDGVITGWGTIHSRTVYIFAEDFTVFGGSLSEMMSKKICKIMKLAIQNGAPLIALKDSGGARIQEGVSSLGGYADIFKQNVLASGVIPQISVIMGPCAGGAVYSPAVTDFTLMVDHTSHMFITGPEVIKTVTGEEVSFEDLGGTHTHTHESGVCDLSFSDEAETLLATRRLMSYLPSNNLDTSHETEPPEEEASQDMKDLLEKNKTRLDFIVPKDSNESYDMSELIRCVMDPDSYSELKKNYAPNLITAFCRLGGKVVGVIANNPFSMAGVLDIKASVKGARFIRFCDAFHIPLVSFVDVPGFLPGSDQEKEGIIRHGAKLLYAYCEATIPLLTVITRKAYGGAYDVMSSKHIGSDLNLAWPTAEIAVMGAKGASKIIFKSQLQKADNPENLEEELTKDYTEKFYHPYIAAKKGYIDAVIYPHETRHYLLEGLKANLGKKVIKPKRKHGNIPL